MFFKIFLLYFLSATFCFAEQINFDSVKGYNPNHDRKGHNKKLAIEPQSEDCLKAGAKKPNKDIICPAKIEIND